MRLPLSLTLTAGLSLTQIVHAVDNLVDVGYAKYQGAVVDSQRQVSAWKGIQYAAPPVGKLRFAAPQDPIVSGTINATRHGATCPPSRPDDWTVQRNYSRFTIGEDCLYASVYAPTKATVNSKLPVVVFFQGGGFISQSSANWDPTEIVSDGQVVFVQFSYRVGLYGFLHSAAVKAAGGDVNAGMRDMIKLLEWVNKNIAQFGGDPDHVVLDGVSAGGSSVALMMAAKIEKKLFVGGIMESGGWATMRTPDHGEEQYQCLLKDKGCANAADGVACLRALSEADIRSSNCWFGPNIDGDLYTDSMENLFAQGKYAKVPSIMGSCANEGAKNNAPSSLNTSADALKWLTDKDPNLSNRSISILNDLYMKPQLPVIAGTGRFWQNAAAAITEIGSHCLTSNIQNSLARDGVPTFNYRYAVRDPADEAAGNGAWHTVNVYSFWGVNRTDGQEPKSYFTTNAPIIPLVRAYWVSFIRNLDPNTDRLTGAVEWKPWEGAEARGNLFIQTNATQMERTSDAKSLRCDIVKPFSNDLTKPPPNNSTTEFNSELVQEYIQMNGTIEPTDYSIGITLKA